MTDDGFKQTLELLAAAGERHGAQFMVIDALSSSSITNSARASWGGVRRTSSPDTTPAGVTKLAFIVPEGTPGTVESGGAPRSSPGRPFLPRGFRAAIVPMHGWLIDSE
jgi:hypothetical protein